MQNETTTTKNLITDFELNELMAKIIDHCFNRWNEKELLIANRIKQFVADFLERKLANELDSANEQARADERQKVLMEAGDSRALGHIDVIRHLRIYGRDHIMEADKRAKGFYEAVNEAERYFNVYEDAELRAKLQEMKERLYERTNFY